jgi:hypothetical protein
MAIELVPLSLPASADASKFASFGREVRGVNPGTLSSEEFSEVEDALYKARLILQTTYPELNVHVHFSMMLSCSAMSP